MGVKAWEVKRAARRKRIESSMSRDIWAEDIRTFDSLQAEQDQSWITQQLEARRIIYGSSMSPRVQHPLDCEMHYQIERRMQEESFCKTVRRIKRDISRNISIQNGKEGP